MLVMQLTWNHMNKAASICIYSSTINSEYTSSWRKHSVQKAAWHYTSETPKISHDMKKADKSLAPYSRDFCWLHHHQQKKSSYDFDFRTWFFCWCSSETVPARQEFKNRWRKINICSSATREYNLEYPVLDHLDKNSPPTNTAPPL